MPGASWVQSSFLGGEWSNTAQGRIDDPAYEIALNVCLNSLPIESGAWTRRPGTMHAMPTRIGAPGRVISFNFQQAAAYTIEFTNQHMRFRSGATLVTTNDSMQVASISTANPAVVQLNSSVTWSTNDQAYFTALGTTAPTLQNRVVILTQIDTTHFSIADGISGLPIDGSTLGWVTTPGTTLNRILDIPISYDNGTWQNIRPVQAELTMYLIDGSGMTKPQVLTATPPTGPQQFATFSLANENFLDGPYLDAVPGDNRRSALTIQGDGSFLVTTGKIPDPRRAVLTAKDVGRYVRLFNEPPSWPGPGAVVKGTVYTLYGQTTDTATYWLCLTTAATTKPGGSLTDWQAVPADQNVVWSWGVITGIVPPGDRFSVSFVVGLLYGTVGTQINTWRLGVYSDEVGWPTIGVYHEGRLWLGGAIPNRVDASQSNLTNSFAPTDIIGNVNADNAISYTFLSDNVNPILWMQSDDRGVICGTQSAEFLISATTQNLALSPTNIQAHPVTHYGSAAVQPRRAGGPIIFVKRFARTLLEYFPDVFSGRMAAPNLTRDSRHLTQSFIREIAYQQELSPNIWARRGDQVLVGWAYKRDNLMSSQGPSFIGGHRHLLGSGRGVESITGGPSIGGNLDTITMITNDFATSVRHVEMLTDLWEEGSPVTSSWYLDDAVRPSSYTWDLVAKTVTLNGMWHLNGKFISVFMAGVDAGDYTVINGSVTVPIDGTANSLLTVQTVQPFLAALPAVIGFTYNSDGQVLRGGPQKNSGAATGPAFGKVSRAHKIAVLVQDTAGGNAGRGLMFGSFFDQLKPALFRTPNQKLIAENVLFSGVYKTTVDNPYTYDEAQLCWRISRPYPATIAAFSAFQMTQDE
jgi:hypothetical protein